MLKNWRARWSRIIDGPPRQYCDAPREHLVPFLWRRCTQRFRRPQTWPDDGIDYTGWSARCLLDTGPIRAGDRGTVLGYTHERQGKLWTILFSTETVDEVSYLTHLPAPEAVELIAPPLQRP